MIGKSLKDAHSDAPDIDRRAFVAFPVIHFGGHIHGGAAVEKLSGIVAVAGKSEIEQTNRGISEHDIR